MSYLNILEQAIMPAFRIRAIGGEITFMEEGSQATNKGFALKASTKQVTMSLEAKLEKNSSHPIFPTINPSVEGLVSVCDGILFCESVDQRPLVFLMELKSTNPGDYLRQMKSGRAYAAWLLELMATHHGLCAPASYFGFLVSSRRKPQRGTTRVSELNFVERNGLRVAEWDHGVPVTLKTLIEAASKAS